MKIVWILLGLVIGACVIGFAGVFAVKHVLTNDVNHDFQNNYVPSVTIPSYTPPSLAPLVPDATNGVD